MSISINGLCQGSKSAMKIVLKTKNIFSAIDDPTMNATIILIVQEFYCYRIWTLKKRCGGSAWLLLSYFCYYFQCSCIRGGMLGAERNCQTSECPPVNTVQFHTIAYHRFFTLPFYLFAYCLFFDLQHNMAANKSDFFPPSPPLSSFLSRQFHTL